MDGEGVEEGWLEKNDCAIDAGNNKKGCNF